MGDYPTTNGFEITGTRSGFFGEEDVVRFPRDGRVRPPSEVGDGLEDDSPGFTTRYAIRPRLGSGHDDPPSQLLTLWALLFALSNLARYHPDVWVGALSLNASEIAVSLDRTLDVALARTPDLLYGALSGGSWLDKLMREKLAEIQTEGSEPLGNV